MAIFILRGSSTTLTYDCRLVSDRISALKRALAGLYASQGRGVYSSETITQLPLYLFMREQENGNNHLGTYYPLAC